MNYLLFTLFELLTSSEHFVELCTGTVFLKNWKLNQKYFGYTYERF